MAPVRWGDPPLYEMSAGGSAVCGDVSGGGGPGGGRGFTGEACDGSGGSGPGGGFAAASSSVERRLA